MKTQTRALNKLRLNASFAAPIQPHFYERKLTESEKQLPTSGGVAVISSLPLRTYDIGQKERIYRDKTRVSMCTVKTQSLEVLCVSIYGYPSSFQNAGTSLNQQRTNEL